jgi:membrane-associated protein
VSVFAQKQSSDATLGGAPRRGKGLPVSSIVSGLTHLSGWVAYAVIAALVFGETAVFLGFVLPGETAVVLGGVLASRGHLSLPTLTAVVVAAAVAGPIVGYEIGRRMGDRLFAARPMRRVPGGPERARETLRTRGGLAVLAGRFIAFVRAVMPAAAGAVRVPYRTFLIYNVAGGLVWGVGYCLLGYLAGSAYSAVESRVGAGLAVAVALIVVAAVLVWSVRRHRAVVARGAAPGGSVPADAAGADAPGVDVAGVDVAGVDAAGVDAAGVDAAGVDAAGTDAPGTDAPGVDVAGVDVAGVDAAGVDAAGVDAPGQADVDRPTEAGDLRAEHLGD